MSWNSGQNWTLGPSYMWTLEKSSVLQAVCTSEFLRQTFSLFSSRCFQVWKGKEWKFCLLCQTCLFHFLVETPPFSSLCPDYQFNVSPLCLCWGTDGLNSLARICLSGKVFICVSGRRLEETGRQGRTYFLPNPKEKRRFHKLAAIKLQCRVLSGNSK